jgi:hypothetical protein
MKPILASSAAPPRTARTGRMPTISGATNRRENSLRRLQIERILTE